MWKMRQGLDGLLEMGKVALHGVKEYGSEDVVRFNIAHSNDTTIVASHFSESVSKRFIIREANVESFDKETDLGICTLIFMKRAKATEEIVGRSITQDIVNVGIGNPVLHKGSKSIIVLSPDVVGIRGTDEVGAGESAFEPGAQAALTCEKIKFTAPLDPIGRAKVKNEVGGPGSAFHSAFSDTDTIGKCAMKRAERDVGNRIIAGGQGHGRGLRKIIAGGHCHGHGQRGIAGGGQSHGRGLRRVTAGGGQSHGRGLRRITAGGHCHGRGQRGITTGGQGHRTGGLGRIIVIIGGVRTHLFEKEEIR
jgi:hypothetical protein